MLNRAKFLFTGAWTLLNGDTPIRSIAFAVKRFALASFRKKRYTAGVLIAEPENSRLFDVKEIGFFVHLYYMDYAVRLVTALGQNAEISNVHVSTPKIEIMNFLRDWEIKSGRRLDIHFTPNIGRNFGPLFVELKQEILKYEFFVHLHSKKSKHQSKKMSLDWSERSWRLLIEDQVLLRRAVISMKSNERLNTISPLVFDLIPPESFSWLCNEVGGAALAKRLSIASSKNRFLFPAGGMFLARTESLRKILELNWAWSDFPEEMGQIDGTTQHAIERMIGVMASQNGGYQGLFDFKSDRFSADESYINSDGAPVGIHYF